MNSHSDSFIEDILAVERAAAILLSAKKERSAELAAEAAHEGRSCPQIIIEAADLLQQLGEPDRALKLLSDGACLDGPTAPLQLTYSRHYREHGDLDAARQWLRGSMLRARPNAALAIALCEIELCRGNDVAANDALELSVQLRWIDTPGLRYAANRLMAIGRGDIAVVPLMMIYLRAKADLALRRELAELLRAHAPFDRIPEAVRTALKLADPRTYSDIAPPIGDDTDQHHTTNWFATSAKAIWDRLLPEINPTKILEVGCYEGASSCYLIDTLAARQAIELHCIDSWEGGVEHSEGGSAQANMAEVEKRFLHNTHVSIQRARHKVDLHIHKERSDLAMARLLADGKQGYFDFIYIDGSHQAPDVLCDAVLGFRLLRENGIIAFDDYLWQESLPYGVDPLRCPKPAIDAFTNLYCRKISVLSGHLYQLYVRKLSD